MKSVSGASSEVHGEKESIAFQKQNKNKYRLNFFLGGHKSCNQEKNRERKRMVSEETNKSISLRSSMYQNLISKLIIDFEMHKIQINYTYNETNKTNGLSFLSPSRQLSYRLITKKKQREKKRHKTNGQLMYIVKQNKQLLHFHKNIRVK